MKFHKLFVTVLGLLVSMMITVGAVSPADLELIGQKVAATKVVEAPAVAAKFVRKAAKEDKEQVAVAALSAGLRAHPAALPSLLTAVIKAAPSATDALVSTALKLAPDSAATITRVAAEAKPSAPRRVLASSGAAALSGGTVTQLPRTGGPPIQIQSYAGADPLRP